MQFTAAAHRQFYLIVYENIPLLRDYGYHSTVQELFIELSRLKAYS